MSETLKKVEELREYADGQLEHAAGYPSPGPQGETLSSIAASLLALLELSIWQLTQQGGSEMGKLKDE